MHKAIIPIIAILAAALAGCGEDEAGSAPGDANLRVEVWLLSEVVTSPGSSRWDLVVTNTTSQAVTIDEPTLRVLWRRASDDTIAFSDAVDLGLPPGVTIPGHGQARADGAEYWVPDVLAPGLYRVEVTLESWGRDAIPADSVGREEVEILPLGAS